MPSSSSAGAGELQKVAADFAEANASLIAAVQNGVTEVSTIAASGWTGAAADAFLRPGDGTLARWQEMAMKVGKQLGDFEERLQMVDKDNAQREEMLSSGMRNMFGGRQL